MTTSRKIIFDIEADNLYDKVSACHLLVAKQQGGKKYVILRGDSDVKLFSSKLKDGDWLIGHNILGFDVPVFTKLYNQPMTQHEFNGVKVTYFDTYYASMYLYPDRESHSLESWGLEFGFPKGDHNDWSKWSQEMEDYCIRDVDLTEKLFNKLVKEVCEV